MWVIGSGIQISLFNILNKLHQILAKIFFGKIPASRFLLAYKVKIIIVRSIFPLLKRGKPISLKNIAILKICRPLLPMILN